MRTYVAVFACLAALSLPVSAMAHPGHDHKVMGTIMSIEGQQVMIKTTEGQERTFQLTSLTKVVRGKQKADARDLRVGMRVVVNVGDGAEPLRAKEVQYSDAPATKTKQ